MLAATECFLMRVPPDKATRGPPAALWCECCFIAIFCVIPPSWPMLFGSASVPPIMSARERQFPLSFE